MHTRQSHCLPVPLQEGSQLSGLLAGLQAERDMLLRSASDKDAELSSLRQQAHSQQSSLDQERDQHNREMEALKAQLQQQVWTDVT